MKRSKHSLSNYKLLSFNMGQLIPCGLVEVLPGDTIQQSTSALIRLSPLLAPVMHPVRVRIHHWFVPHRLTWANWEEFITGGAYNSTPPTHPQFSFATGGRGQVQQGDLADYLGIPPTGTNTGGSALPFRAYNMIWNEFYRDQDLQTELTNADGDGTDDLSNSTLQNVCWEKDYYTSARPWAQKGLDVALPGDLASTVVTTENGNRAIGRRSDTNAAVTGAAVTTDAAGELNLNTVDSYWDPNGTLRILMAHGTVNELREAFAMQNFMENRARFGSRYTEYLAYLGVKSSDARLQRPEYLGGGKATIQFSEVLQTGVTTDGDDEEGVGNLRGHGISAVRSNRYRRFFEEHGYIVTMISVLPKTIYTQGLHRLWSKTAKTDYWQKEFERIGQQEVYNREVYLADSAPGDIFGYQDRYDEYRRIESSVAGEFRDTALNYWHMARTFGSDVTLNADFVSANPTDRIYASTATDQLQVMVNHSIQARRLVSKTGTPSIY